MKSRRKIFVITATRAEYGLLKNLIKELNNSIFFEINIIVSGSHLSESHGFTYKEILDDGFKIKENINLDIDGDKPIDIAKYTSRAISGFSSLFENNKPDLIIILGDRYELLGVALSAMFFSIPIAHLYGGEITFGAIDDSIRHSLTKLSHIHFVANETYKKRVIQLGENPKLVFNVGGLGAEAVMSLKLFTKSEIEKKLGFKFKNKNLLVTFHPTTSINSSEKEITETLKSLAERTDTQIIFTMPNADHGNKFIFDAIKRFSDVNKNSCFFVSLGQKMYLSCLKNVDAVVGNSSSGLLEAPSFKIATINIGKRQEGRMKASSVIDCEPISDNISDSLDKIYTDQFKKNILSAVNPNFNGATSTKIVSFLEKINFKELIPKTFFDLM